MTNITATAADRPTTTIASTRALLAAGLITGPLYVGVSLTQALTREGFDLTRHAWSILANGSLGWIQQLNLLLNGLLIVAFAVGVRRVLTFGRGSVWAPRLLGLFGVGMALASVFKADPSLGFPPGTPADYNVISMQGVGHMASAGIGFAGVVAACIVLARRFAADGERGWAWWSRGTAVLFGGSFVVLSGSGGAPAAIVAFTVGVITVFAWVATLAARLRDRMS